MWVLDLIGVGCSTYEKHVCVTFGHGVMLRLSFLFRFFSIIHWFRFLVYLRSFNEWTFMQWFSMKRQHAVIVMADSLYYTKFRDYCKVGFTLFWIKLWFRYRFMVCSIWLESYSNSYRFACTCMIVLFLSCYLCFVIVAIFLVCWMHPLFLIPRVEY